MHFFHSLFPGMRCMWVWLQHAWVSVEAYTKRLNDVFFGLGLAWSRSVRPKNVLTFKANNLKYDFTKKYKLTWLRLARIGSSSSSNSFISPLWVASHRGRIVCEQRVGAHVVYKKRRHKLVLCCRNEYLGTGSLDLARTNLHEIWAVNVAFHHDSHDEVVGKQRHHDHLRSLLNMRREQIYRFLTRPFGLPFSVRLHSPNTNPTETNYQ